jgi:hypothetical protein
MKTFKGILTALTALAFVAVFATGCCCFKHRSEYGKCKNLIVDGSFETPLVELNVNNQGDNLDGTPWTISPMAHGSLDQILNNGAPNTALKNNPNPASTLGFPTQYYNTPCGKQFIVLGPTDLPTNFVMTTVSQDIKTELKKDGKYHLSFLQSSCDDYPTPGRANIGMVKVELALTSGGTDVFNQTFTLPKQSKWTKQAVSIPITDTGFYTIKFSDLDVTNADTGLRSIAIIDAASLCDKNDHD